MDDFLKPYLLSESPQITEIKINNLSMLDVKWHYDFVGGKPERLKVINHLKKIGYVYRNSFYVKIL
jgi:hypothetical protein